MAIRKAIMFAQTPSLIKPTIKKTGMKVFKHTFNTSDTENKFIRSTCHISHNTTPEPKRSFPAK
jgi:hypothetical protein